MLSQLVYSDRIYPGLSSDFLSFADTSLASQCRRRRTREKNLYMVILDIRINQRKAVRHHNKQKKVVDGDVIFFVSFFSDFSFRIRYLYLYTRARAASSVQPKRDHALE